jgi:hypothetical protein
MKTKSLFKIITALLSAVAWCVALTPTNAAVTFSFTGYIQFQQSAPVTGLSVGDQFYGTYTFDPLTTGQPFLPSDSTLDTAYWALQSWVVTIPSENITLTGLTGQIGVGNNTPYYQSDRYIVTMFPDSNNIPVISGHTFSYFQIDIFDFGNGVGADMLQDSSLPLVPPDLNLVPDNDQTGRFVFQDAVFQNRTTSLTVVPEPSLNMLIITAALCAICCLRERSFKHPTRASPR